MAKHHRGTDRMLYLDEPIPFRCWSRDCYGFVIDDGRVFARWFDGRTVHLAWVKTHALRSVLAAHRSGSVRAA